MICGGGPCLHSTPRPDAPRTLAPQERKALADELLIRELQSLATGREEEMATEVACGEALQRDQNGRLTQPPMRTLSPPQRPAVPERRALATRTRNKGCGGALVPAQMHRLHCL